MPSKLRYIKSAILMLTKTSCVLRYVVSLVAAMPRETYTYLYIASYYVILTRVKNKYEMNSYVLGINTKYKSILFSAYVYSLCM